MISLDEARSRVLEPCRPLPTVTLPLDEALGCVTAAGMRAGADVPPFANTAMDGYAVRATDTAGATAAAPVELEVIGTLAAGAAPDRPVEAGQAMRIMTGAPIPEGADAVVMVELTTAVDGGRRVRVAQAASPHDHVRDPGGDIRGGDEVVAARTVLTPGHLGVLASIGVAQVEVYPRARVGVLSTGDELVDGPEDLRPGQIRDSNRHTLLALLRQSGCDAVDLGLARDDEREITAAIERGVATCDALLTSGGVSVGDFDYVKVVLDRLGTMSWMQVAIRPAKPLAFGTVGDVPVFGLPGNPVSSMVSFELFARPALRQMMGHRMLDRPRIRALADEDMPRTPDGKTHFVRVVAEAGSDGRVHVRSSGGQSSHLLRAMALANALAVLPDGEGAARGDAVDALLLSNP